MNWFVPSQLHNIPSPSKLKAKLHFCWIWWTCVILLPTYCSQCWDRASKFQKLKQIFHELLLSWTLMSFPKYATFSQKWMMSLKCHHPMFAPLWKQSTPCIEQHNFFRSSVNSKLSFRMKKATFTRVTVLSNNISFLIKLQLKNCCILQPLLVYD